MTDGLKQAISVLIEAAGEQDCILACFAANEDGTDACFFNNVSSKPDELINFYVRLTQTLRRLSKQGLVGSERIKQIAS
jgi:hypothetical protein